MKKIILWALLFTFQLTLFAGVQHLLPKPQKILSQNADDRFTIGQVALNVPSDLTNVFTEWIVQECGGAINASATKTITVEMVANVSGAEFQDEAYLLKVTGETINIKAATRQGAFWALQSLAQLADGDKGSISLPSVEILDWPAFPIRGYMHDVGRSYIQYDELKKQIKLLARYKINVFHWHLTEYQGWRLESKLYPQLNATSNFTRHAGGYYTIAQAKELVTLCNEYGMTVIPEIDMPGHSDAFTRAFGFTMQTPQGLEKVKELLAEACETFEGTPWMHIGTDEVTFTMPNFLPEVLQLLKEKNRKVMSWRPGYNYTADQIDMMQLWRGTTTPMAGVANVDCRLHYINHFDGFADIAGMYNSNILNVQKRTADIAGTIVAAWNDRMTRSDKDIMIQNQFYASVLAIGERAWIGGSDKYITQRGTMIPAPHTQEYKDFADWERRFLYAKEHHLKNEPIAYVKQSHAKWRITDQFANNGILTSKFAPEDSLATVYNVGGKTYNTKVVSGSGIYLRHVWGEGTIPGFYTSPQTNSTAYAYTWVYSPKAQKVGAWIETQNYGRSEKDIPPRQGKWDYKESRIWVNDSEIAPPTWESQHTNLDNETPLTNENFTARPPIQIDLKEGWNKVLLKLPIGSFSISQVRLLKWMFAFAFVTPDGKKEIEDIIWSPDKNLNPSADELGFTISEAKAVRNSATLGSDFGQYSLDAIRKFEKAIETAQAVVKNGATEEDFSNANIALLAAIELFRNSANAPIVSNDQHQAYYKLSTPERESKCISFQGVNADLIGENWAANTDKLLWKFIRLTDGSYALVSKVSEAHISPNSAYNTALKAIAGTPESGGWTIAPSATAGCYILSSNGTQFNQTGGNLGYKIYNWGGGNNTTDAGCKYKFELISSNFPELPTDALKAAISKALGELNGKSAGTQPGDYSETAYNALNESITSAELMLDENPTEAEITAKITELNTLTEQLKSAIIVPLCSTEADTYWYSFHTPNRGVRYVTFKGNNENVTGDLKNVASGSIDDTQLWKLISLGNGSAALINKSSESHISPNSATPSPIKAQSGVPSSGGWTFKPIGTNKHFIITSGTVQFNQQNATPFAILNWGSGTNTTDTGCQYIVTLEKSNLSSSIPENSLTKGKVWVENGVVYSNGLDAPLQIFSIEGTVIAPNKKLSKGIYIVRSKDFAQKIIVI